MEVDKVLVKVTLSNDLIKEAHILSMEAHKQQQHYITNNKKHVVASSSSSVNVSIFAFPGSWELKDWYDDDCFGETIVDQTLHPSLRRIGEDKLAKVNKGFLQRFKDLMNNSGFKSEVQLTSQHLSCLLSDLTILTHLFTSRVNFGLCFSFKSKSLARRKNGSKESIEFYF